MPILGTVIDKWGPATPQQLRDWKAIGQVGYLSMTPGNPKNMTPAAKDALIREGFSVALVFEQSFDDWKHGYERGKVYGQKARTDARTRFNWPDGVPLGIAVDDNIFQHDLATAMAHVQGFRDGAGSAWLYGTAFLIDHCFDRSFISHGMQSCSTGFYDNARVSQHSALRQHCHPGHDTNDVLLPNWGQVPSGIVIPNPPAHPPTHTQERDMLTVHGTKVLDNDHLPIITINPENSRQLLALYCAPFAEVDGDPDKVVDFPGGQAFNLDGAAVSIAPWNDAVDPANKSSAVAVLYDKAGHNEVHKAALKPGLWLQ